MSNTVKVILFTIAVPFLIAGALVMYGMGVYNQANKFEVSLKAEQTNNKNILSNYGKKIVEAAQVPEMMRDDFVKVVEGQIKARYGEGGSKATFQWLKENNIAPDSVVYVKLQQMIEAGRNEFATGQTKLISVKQGYETVLGSAPRGFVMKLFGYPRVNLADFDIVSDARTDKAFETKKEEAIKIR